jgi:hypothetical protein
MTTPQTILWGLESKMNMIINFLEGDEDCLGLGERLSKIALENEDMRCSLQRLENQINLIILHLLESKNG